MTLTSHWRTVKDSAKAWYFSTLKGTFFPCFLNRATTFSFCTGQIRQLALGVTVHVCACTHVHIDDTVFTEI